MSIFQKCKSGWTPDWKSTTMCYL